MADSLISQFRREYNSPIETDRQVPDIASRDAISGLRRWAGMLVYVTSEGATYELRGGVDNTNWSLFTGIGEAPFDGSTYGRKDGSWFIMPSSFSGTARLASWSDTAASFDGIRTDVNTLSNVIQSGAFANDSDFARLIYNGQVDPSGGTTSLNYRVNGVLIGEFFNVGGATGLIAWRIEIEFKRITSTTAEVNIKTFYPSNMTFKRFTVSAPFGTSFSVAPRITATNSGALFSITSFTSQNVVTS